MGTHEAILHDGTANQHRPVTAGDQFSTETQKLIAASVMAAAISTDAGNQIVSGSDGKLNVAPATFLAGSDTPDAYTGQAAKAVMVNAAETALEFASLPPSGVSADAGNDLVLGTDGKPYLAETVTALDYDGGTLLAYTCEDGTTATHDLSPLVVQPGTTDPLMDGVVSQGVSGNFSRDDHVHPTDTSRAPLASPDFTGVPTAPTPAAGDNSTTLATTAFVAQVAATINGALPGTTNPLMDGVVSQGVSGNFSRDDHVHPTDTSRAPLASPDFTGVPTAPTPAAGDSSTKLATTAFVTNGMPVTSGLFRNLKSSATGTNASVTVTAEGVVLGSAANAYVTTRNVNLTISSAGAGANGLDTGAVAASTWYSVWVVYNPTTLTTAGLLSLSATAPTLPAGYTHYARVGWIRTDATVNKFPLGFTQFGRAVRYRVAAGSNVVGTPRMVAPGVTGNCVVPTWVAVATGAFVPTTAAAIQLLVQVCAGAGVVAVAPSNAYGVYNSTTNPPYASADTAGASGLTATSMALESANIYMATNNVPNAGALYCAGWEDNI